MKLFCFVHCYTQYNNVPIQIFNKYLLHEMSVKPLTTGQERKSFGLCDCTEIFVERR